ncbi:MAG: hypothetical protein KAI24_07590, partial [Planctomycetes bacterium]|nr:hypothetical protein [Planctomycetota bacterium]
MNDYLLQFTAGNLLVSSSIALAAWLAQTRLRRPVLAHLLWIMALVKLLTPPLFTLPMVPLPGEPAAAAPGTPTPTGFSPADLGPAAAASFEPDAVAATAWLDVGDAAIWLWVIGSAIVLLVSGLRIARFDRLLRQSSATAEPALEHQLLALARRFDLSR